MSHQYRAYPTAQQEDVFFNHVGQCRWVWNQALAKVKNKEPFFVLSKTRADLDWLREGASAVQEQALRELQVALRHAKNKTHRFPTFKKKGENEGFCVRDVTVRKLNGKWAELTVPKCGRVKFRLSRPLPDKYGMAHIKLDSAGHWHVSFSAPQAPIEREPTGAAVGIDRGVATTLALSDQQMFRAPKMRPREARRIERLQQQLARQKKGSARRRKTKSAISQEHAQVARRRKNWIEKSTTRLVRDYDIVVLEDLRVKNMVVKPAPKPDSKQPGHFLPNGARAKAGLNRAIHQQGWSMFATRLEQKASASGVTVIKVNPAYTSQQCRNCGHTARENRESQAVFSCKSCGHTNHADINAAENILARGLTLVAPTPGQGASRLTPAARASQSKDCSENSVEGAAA